MYISSFKFDRNCLPDERRYKGQTNEFKSPCGRGAESTCVGRYKEPSQAMIGGELRKTRSPHDRKHGTNISHSSVLVPKSLCSSYEPASSHLTASHPKDFDSRNCNSVPSPSPVPPPPPLRGSSSLLASRYISSVSHEKYPSWPSCDPSAFFTTSTTTTTTTATTCSKSKSWSVEEQLLQNDNYVKDRLAAKQQVSQVTYPYLNANQ
ncbi:hypothetical protein V9T40_005136 [Parthenolecanium corni]|uniref:Uncharacterized protein n=1 Tax=Parthenolecanium corni TaxID=536013 RepID=A0AAN9TDA8_9HEMI